METLQAIVAHVTTKEAEVFLTQMRNRTVLQDNGIEVYAVDAEPIEFLNQKFVPGMHIMVRANSERAIGIGIGYILGKMGWS